MAYTTINNGKDYFNPVLFTGNGSNDHAITGVGFQPDWVWLKGRNAADGNNLWDINRGVNKRLFTHNSNAELADTNSLKSFDSDGFTMDNDSGINGSGDTYITWNWLASNTTASNSDGSITSTVSVNTTSGLSIVTYTGNATNGATVGHGLGKVPSMVITKARNDSPSHWRTYHVGLTDYTYAVTLNDTNASATGYGLHATPTSSVFALTNSSQRNQNTINYIAYCFAEIQGYSKFGKYTGNGNTDGPFIYTGFKPSFLLVKNSSDGGEGGMFDTARNTFNVVNARVSADSDGTEYSGDSNRDFDFLSNGIKVRNGSAQVFNTSGQTHIYMAFAEHPFVSSEGVPVTAR